MEEENFVIEINHQYYLTNGNEITKEKITSNDILFSFRFMFPDILITKKEQVLFCATLKEVYFYQFFHYQKPKEYSLQEQSPFSKEGLILAMKLFKEWLMQQKRTKKDLQKQIYNASKYNAKAILSRQKNI